MSLIPWRSKQEMCAGETPSEVTLVRFREEMGNLFDRFFRDPWGTSVLGSLPARLGWGPRINLAESEDSVTIAAEMPGVDPKDIEINVTGNTLTIRANKSRETEEKGRGIHCVECQYGDFHRAIQLPGAVDPDQVNASVKNGALTVSLAKRTDAKPKRIPVRSA